MNNEHLLQKILIEQQEIKKLLQAISRKEQFKIYKSENEHMIALIISNEDRASVQIIESNGIRLLNLNRQF